jgi:hypothetical protein
MSLELMLRVKSESRRIPKALVDRLRRIHTRTSTTGYKDFEVGALVSGVVALGEVRNANNILSDYLRVRRCSLPEHSVLRDARRQIRGSIIMPDAKRS